MNLPSARAAAPTVEDPTPPPEDWHDPLAVAYRRWGHLAAAVDPLDRIPRLVHPDIAELEKDAPAERVEALRRAYCGPLTADFAHLSDRERACWLVRQLEGHDGTGIDRTRALRRLLEAELFERFVHRRYVGSKRYSLEGAAGLVWLLDKLFDTAAEGAGRIAMLAMSHRGRLTVMVQNIGIAPEAVFAGLEDVDPRSILGSGDVKYHMGATGVHRAPGGHELQLHLVSNPSHLEAVGSVLVGRARARQIRAGERGIEQVLPIWLHGDAAFAGQGITSETINLSRLEGYHCGGTIHVIVNNLIGFTAEPEELHSSRWAADAVKRAEIPILRVHGEDPAALARAARIAVQYRQRYHEDILVDLIAYRRHGHSEVEDPTTTSPKLYALVADHPPLHERLAQQWQADPAWLSAQKEEVETRLARAQDKGRASQHRPVLRRLPAYWDRYVGGQYDPDGEMDTSITVERIEAVAQTLEELPPDFHIHPKIHRFLDQRIQMLRGQTPLDFGSAEAAAFGSLLAEGYLVRLTGQDSRRGTFNHRNAALVDVEDGHVELPLARLATGEARLEIFDSPLSEASVLGYEYGFSRDWPDGLVVWEAQFGDFANEAQVIIDQFLAAGEDKWRLLSGLVLLLPHGYEGQGPEHSSARIERFLQLCSEHNMQVCQPTTAAQYFHLLRRQVLRKWRKPLVVFTPKGMLRSKRAASTRDELVRGGFRAVLTDPEIVEADRVLLCTGKIVHELRAERARREDSRTAIVAIEQLYPFPEAEVHAELRRLATARKIVWVQEEPANMGALAFVRPELQRLCGGRHLTSVKRSASASPATGSTKAHRLEQEALIRLAFS